MQEYLQHVGSDLAKQSANLSLLELSRQMGVIGGPDEAPFLLNVGLMMFNPEPSRFFPTMQANGSPPAEFDFDEDHSYFMVRLSVHPAALEVGEFADAVTGQVTGQVQRLLAVCNGALSRAELQEKLGLRHRDNFIEAYLQPALNAGLLEMTIPDKPRSSKQKYRLTEKGRAVVGGPFKP
jgi:hypothetical protein